MRPQGDRCWRKARRKALRGVPAGRRATRAVETTYGRHQKEQDRLAGFLAGLAARRETEAAAAAGPGDQAGS